MKQTRSWSHPILFSAPMVLAILHEIDYPGKGKTTTRRLVRNPDFYGCLTGDCPHTAQRQCDAFMASEAPFQYLDVLWVREAYRVHKNWDGYAPRDIPNGVQVWYEASGPHPGEFGKLRPGLFMMRWMSRILLGVQSVSCSRLQRMWNNEAIAEGIEDLPGYSYTPMERFRALWDHLHGPGSWKTNPWVWVYRFGATKVKP